MLEASDLVRLIGDHVSLRPRGKEFVGLCPFHEDKNPSMYVSPSKQIYKCFSCGAGGDAFSFMMGYHKMSFPEALEHLAERNNIKLPKRSAGTSGEGDEGPSPRQRIQQANQLAQRFFKQTYTDASLGKIARDYVTSRGISDAMVEAFGIGCAPDAWDALAGQVQQQRWDAHAFEQAGLIANRKSGNGQYDRLRHRLIFPICDTLGRPIAFGGRTLPDSKLGDKSDAKYLNSPETPLFNKSATLFGLHLAQQTIIAKRTAVIVEGYTDVVAAHQADRANVVATLGTALTKEHARQLRRYCDRVVLVFDADEAGQKAADRALNVFFEENLDVHIAVLPDGLDPADLLADEAGLARWDDAVDQAVDAMRFQFDRVQKAFDQTDSLTGRQRIIEEYLRTLVGLGLAQLDTSRKGLVIAHLAELLRVSTGEVDAMIRRLTANARRRPAPPTAPDPTIDHDDHELPGDIVPPQNRRDMGAQQVAERHIVGCLLNDAALFHELMPDGRTMDESVLPSDFADEHVRAVYDSVYTWLGDHDDLQPADFRDVFDNDEAKLRAAMDMQLEVDTLSRHDGEQRLEMLRRCARTLEKYRAEREYREEKARMNTPANDEPTPLLRRLELAKAHRNANPSSVVRPGVSR
ncbi:MAG: DNA primase [Phycisphaeraceae bacterium]